MCVGYNRVITLLCLFESNSYNLKMLYVHSLFVFVFVCLFFGFFCFMVKKYIQMGIDPGVLIFVHVI